MLLLVSFLFFYVCEPIEKICFDRFTPFFFFSEANEKICFDRFNDFFFVNLVKRFASTGSPSLNRTQSVALRFRPYVYANFFNIPEFGIKKTFLHTSSFRSSLQKKKTWKWIPLFFFGIQLPLSFVINTDSFRYLPP